MGNKIAEQIKLFMEPRSVAIIGQPRKVGIDPISPLEVLRHINFPGVIYPVNPYASEICGIKSYPSVMDIPDDIDLAIILTPRSRVINLVRECTQKGIKSIIVMTQGFADADEEGKHLQEELLTVAKEGGARVLGPNTLGTFNAYYKFSSTWGPIEMERLPIGVICQTGMVVWGFSKLKMIGKGIDLGNACDINYSDALEYFEQDPEVKLIVLHIEGIREGRKFINMASRVSRKKPIIALKTGITEKGANAALSHSGSMVGNAAIYRSVFKTCGIAQVDDVDELQDSVKAFLNLPLMKGRNVCLAAITGGGGIVAVDACEKYGLQLAELSPQTVDRIAKLSPKWLPLRNPMDIWPAIMQVGDDFRSGLKMVIEPLLADVNVDAVFVVGFPPYGWEGIASCADVVTELTNIYTDKPLIFFSHLTYTDKFAGIWEKTGKIVFFDSIGRGVKALSQLAQYADFLRNSADPRFFDTEGHRL